MMQHEECINKTKGQVDGKMQIHAHLPRGVEVVERHLQVLKKFHLVMKQRDTDASV